MATVAALLTNAYRVAAADPIRFLLIVFVVTAFFAVFIRPKPTRKPSRGQFADNPQYTAWLEHRADAFEIALKWYANQDNGAEARRVLAVMNGERP